MLTARNITKTIGESQVLKEVSLSIERGEIVALIGPSGAGKTSFLRAMSLTDLSDSGSLEVDGVEYVFPLTQPRVIDYPYPDVTVVFQQFFLWPHMNIRQNLTFPLGGDVDQHQFDDVVNLFQMKSFLDRYPNQVSLGESQRTALARALLLNPKYLLLDEITSALDVEQSYVILCHLKLMAERGVGIIFVSHALHLAKKISHKVLFMDGGRVVEEGTGDILKSAKTDRLKQFVSMS